MRFFSISRIKDINIESICVFQVILLYLEKVGQRTIRTAMRKYLKRKVVQIILMERRSWRQSLQHILPSKPLSPALSISQKSCKILLFPFCNSILAFLCVCVCESYFFPNCHQENLMNSLSKACAKESLILQVTRKKRVSDSLRKQGGVEFPEEGVFVFILAFLFCFKNCVLID